MQVASTLAPAATRVSLRTAPWARLYPLALAGLTLLGFACRIAQFNHFPFREDEAIYSFWALHWLRVDPWLLTVWPDKPPLFLWLLAGGFQLLGPTQATAQWLNIAISTLTVPIVALIAQQLWGRRAAWIAALVYTLNPFAISFAPTAFTDPLLVLTGMLALLFALRGRAGGAGFWLGAAIMTKQQGVLYAPLVVALLVCKNTEYGIRDTGYGIRNTQYALRFLLGLSLVIAPILYWDSLRWAVAPSPWDLSVQHYGALQLLPPEVWLTQLRNWAQLVWYLTASWPLWGALVTLTLLSCLPAKTKSVPTERQSTLLLGLWGLAFCVLHIVTSVQIWDRYLLPLAPLLALWAGWLVTRWSFTALPIHYAGISLVLLVLLTPPAYTAQRGGYPLGSDHGDYAGLPEALDWVAQTFPTDVVLYHQRLGWHYRFYFFEQVTSHQYDLRWFPHAVYLADNATKVPHRPKLLIQPDWSPVRDLAQQLAVRRLTLTQVHRFGHFTVYEIVQTPQPLCTWCLCQISRRWEPLSSSAGPRRLVVQP